MISVSQLKEYAALHLTKLYINRFWKLTDQTKHISWEYLNL